MRNWLVGLFSAGALGLGAITAVVQCESLMRVAAGG